MPFEPSAVLAGIVSTAERVGRTRLVVAFSGGLDSSVLLHLVASDQRLPLRAVHIDHGLQGEQARWRTHVEQFCANLGVPLEVRQLNLQPATGDSVEAMARDARHSALADALATDELLLLAQHRDDQAETLLLQLLRGAGPAGLAAMPVLAVRDGHAVFRPLLDIDRAALRQYAEARGLTWFDDPSNADTRFDRNYLRAAVMPAIQARWPGAGKTLARAATLQADTMRVMAQQAAADARAVGLEPGRLSVTRLLRLAPERQANVLRFALSWLDLPLPPASRLQSVLGMAGSPSGRGEVCWPGASVRRYRDGLYLMLPLSPAPADDLVLQPGPDGVIELPGDLGSLLIDIPSGLQAATLSCHFRRGGERVREAPGRPSTTLASWFQAHDVPPWQRNRTPLLFAGDALVAIGESTLSGDCRQARGLRVRWRRAGRELAPSLR